MDTNQAQPSPATGPARPDRPAYLANFVEIAFDAIIAFDAQGRITFWNPAAEQLYGWSPAEALGRTADELFWQVRSPQEEEERSRQRDLLARGETVRAESRPRRKDQSLIWVESAARAVFDDAGRLVGYVSMHRDIGERKEVEMALRQSEERFVSFMEHLPGLAWIKDLQGRYVYANAAAEKAFRATRPRLYGSTDGDIFPTDVAEEFARNDRRALAEGRGIQVIETLPQDDGVLHYSLVSKFPIPGPDGNALLVGGTAFDITEHKAAEEALRASEARFRSLSNAVPSIVWTAAPDGTILYSNENWYRYTGITPEDNASNWAELVLHPDDYERCLRAWAEAIQNAPDEYLIEVRNRRYDGQYRWFQTRAIPGRDQSGAVTGWYGVTTDIHERILAENALRENQNELKALNESLEQKVQERTAEVRRLASDLTKAEQRERHRIAHILHDDLQQRLYALQVQVAFVRDGLAQPDQALTQDLDDMQAQLDDALAITRHLSIDLSPPILHDEGLAHAIGWLAAQMQEQYGLKIELQAQGPFVVPDEDIQVLLFSCVRELLFNVVKHAGVKQAAVELQRRNGDLHIQVRDPGRGFHTAGPAQASGGGEAHRVASFGLPMLRHRLGLFGGRMEIQSEPGAGTQVTLTIPVYPAAAGGP